MLALIVAIAAAIVLTPEATAQEYILLSSIVLTRSGDRTPAYLGDSPIVLTPLGANQAFDQGQYFRSRYLTSNETSNGIDGAAIHNLNPSVLNGNDLYVATLDQQWNAATAQAFLQGLYPPLSPDTSVPTMLNPSGIVANGSYIDAPLNGYQYAQIHTLNADDPGYLYLSANLNCPKYAEAAAEYYTSSEFWAISNSTANIYETVGTAMLNNVVNSSELSYRHAYAIYDYLNYMNSHSNASAVELAGFRDAETNTSDLSTLRWLADRQQYAKLANLTASPSLPSINGTVSTIAGNRFASFVLAQFSSIILEGQLSAQDPTSNPTKLTLLFADHHPFISFLSLAGLRDQAFTGLPNFAASLAFELFTYQNLTAPSTPPFPASTSDLWVRFYLRNGTDPSTPYQSFPLFGNSPSNTDLRWSDFVSGMQGIALDSVADWCTVCGAEATSSFCAAWDADASSENGVDMSSPAVRARMAAIGAVGGLLALVLAAGVGAAMAYFGGYRVQRVPKEMREGKKGKKSGLGGFKGSDKMASDRDLSLPDKNGTTVVGISIERDGETGPVGGHERVGSWEMKKPAAVNNNRGESLRGLSLDEARDVDHFGEPVKAFERV